MTSFKSIPIDQIVEEDRPWPVDQDQVKMIAKSFAERGQQQPIKVVPREDHFLLIFGRKRLAAARQLGHTNIDVKIGIIDALETADHYTIDCVMENLARGVLNALEKAEHRYELKLAYESIFPISDHGGDRKSKIAKNQVANIATRSLVIEKTGISERAFYNSISICKGLSPEIRARIHGTDLAKHQAGLKLLSEQNSGLQEKILHIIEDKDNPADNVTDALICANGERKIPEAEKRIATVHDYMGRMKPAERTAIFQTFEDEVKEFAQAKGWL